MQTDPALEWRRLAEHYREISDEELRQLADDFTDLTETAQQALRQEMQSRGLGDPKASTTQVPPAIAFQEARSMTRKNFDLFAGSSPNSDLLPSDPEERDEEDGQEDGAPVEYTWKTLLRECNDLTEAKQLSTVLTKAGIQSWTEWPPGYSIGFGNPRVVVAADQLDQARAIAERPIPQEIIEESKLEPPEFQTPVCPKCGAEDPTLEGVDPTNSWHCEQCDWDWTESAEGADESGEKSGNAAP
jgi:hypothetical protein